VPTPYAGVALGGRWTVTSAQSNFSAFEVTLTEAAAGWLGGSWRLPNGGCLCGSGHTVYDGVVRTEPSAVLGVGGSRRVGSSVVLLLVAGDRAFEPIDPYMLYVGTMTGADRIEGSLLVSPGASQAGGDGYRWEGVLLTR
jgi:hypothetical protein